MFSYHLDQLKIVMEEIIRQNVPADTWTWMKEKGNTENGIASFNTIFVSLPRKTGKPIIRLSDEQDKNIRAARTGITIKGWTIDRLSRVWLLMNVESADKEKYFQLIENLFLAAEVNELVALYSALPFLPYPELWTKRCAEGIRNNIGDVLQAIMCDNPYPSEYLEEPAWNQLVLKVFFTEKPIDQVIGLDKRANRRLAKTLSDYAHERWAAHRPVSPQLWRCIGPFINDELFPDIEKIANAVNQYEREAAALACWDSDYPPAKNLLNNTNLKSAIESGELSWDILAKKMNNYVLQ